MSLEQRVKVKNGCDVCPYFIPKSKKNAAMSLKGELYFLITLVDKIINVISFPKNNLLIYGCYLFNTRE